VVTHSPPSLRTFTALCDSRTRSPSSCRTCAYVQIYAQVRKWVVRHCNGFAVQLRDALKTYSHCHTLHAVAERTQASLGYNWEVCILLLGALPF
jgi:hypothetical protein